MLKALITRHRLLHLQVWSNGFLLWWRSHQSWYATHTIGSNECKWWWNMKNRLFEKTIRVCRNLTFVTFIGFGQNSCSHVDIFGREMFCSFPIFILWKISLSRITPVIQVDLCDTQTRTNIITQRPGQNTAIFQTTVSNIFLSENICTSIKYSLKFIRKGPISIIVALFQVMPRCRPGHKQLSEPTMVRFSDTYMRHSALYQPIIKM